MNRLNTKSLGIINSIEAFVKTKHEVCEFYENMHRLANFFAAM